MYPILEIWKNCFFVLSSIVSSYLFNIGGGYGNRLYKLLNILHLLCICFISVLLLFHVLPFIFAKAAVTVSNQSASGADGLGILRGHKRRRI